MAAEDWRVTCAFAGRLKKCASLTTFVCFRSKRWKKPAHLALQPFGQIPRYEEGDRVLFESGAIVLHVAERRAGLLPDDANARARAIAWMFVALNTVEPPIVEHEMTMYFERDKAWYEERLGSMASRVASVTG